MTVTVPSRNPLPTRLLAKIYWEGCHDKERLKASEPWLQNANGIHTARALEILTWRRQVRKARRG